MVGGEEGTKDPDDPQQRAIDAWQAGDMAAARAAFELALQQAHARGDQAGEAMCLHRLGSVALRDGDLAGAFEHFEAARKLYRELEDGPGYAAALHQLGTICLHRRDHDEARRLSRAAMNVQHQVGDTKGVARSLYQIAASFMEESNFPEAAEGFRHAIKVMRGVEDFTGVALALHNLGVMAERAGDLKASFRFIAASAAVRAGTRQPEAETALAQAREQAAKAGLDPAGFDAALEAAAEDFLDDDGESLISEAFG